MAILIAILKIIEYRYTIKKFDIDLYLGVVAIIFTGIGIWTGIQLLKRKEQKEGITHTNEAFDQTHVNHSDKVLLSEREKEVLLSMSEGLSNQEIADKLFISIHTVKTHSSNLFSKLQVKRRTQAIQKSKELGII